VYNTNRLISRAVAILHPTVLLNNGVGALMNEIKQPILELGMLFPNKDSKRKFRYAVYLCDNCHNEFTARVSDVKSRNRRKCRSCSHSTHKLSKHPLMSIHGGMKQRCYNKKNSEYHRYGGRGIKLCEEWESNFINFFNWAIENGYKKNLTIDRIDSNKGYSPKNCRFTTCLVQSQNQSISKKRNKTGYCGVYRSKSKFTAQIQNNYKKEHLGTFPTAEAAAIAYDNFIIENKTAHTRNFQ